MRTDAFVTDILPPDMKVLMNHIYEYKKGVRSMVLFTFNKRYESYATSRLRRQNISYILQPVGNDRIICFREGVSRCYPSHGYSPAESALT